MKTRYGATPEERLRPLRRRDDVLLEEHLDPVRDPDEEALRAGAIRPHARLHSPRDPALDPGDDPGGGSHEEEEHRRCDDEEERRGVEVRRRGRAEAVDADLSSHLRRRRSAPDGDRSRRAPTPRKNVGRGRDPNAVTADEEIARLNRGYFPRASRDSTVRFGRGSLPEAAAIFDGWMPRNAELCSGRPSSCARSMRARRGVGGERRGWRSGASRTTGGAPAVAAGKSTSTSPRKVVWRELSPTPQKSSSSASVKSISIWALVAAVPCRPRSRRSSRALARAVEPRRGTFRALSSIGGTTPQAARRGRRAPLRGGRGRAPR